MTNYHAVLWIDHHEAKILHFNADSAEKVDIHPDHPVHHIHSHAGGTGDGDRSVENPEYYERVAQAVADAGALLVTGPSNAKLEFKKHLDRHHPALAGHIAGVESLAHLSDGELIAHARRAMKVADRMSPQRG